jgi:hypothetical protein
VSAGVFAGRAAHPANNQTHTTPLQIAHAFIAMEV